MIELFIPYMGPSLNSIYAGVHWSERNKQAKFGHIACKAACREAGINPFDYPVTLTFIPVLGKGARSRDCSNYSYAAKIIEDGLVRCGILEDDSDKYVRGFSIKGPAIVDRKGVSGFRLIIERAL